MIVQHTCEKCGKACFEIMMFSISMWKKGKRVSDAEI